jgi:hypothetical protein
MERPIQAVMEGILKRGARSDDQGAGGAMVREQRARRTRS